MRVRQWITGMRGRVVVPALRLSGVIGGLGPGRRGLNLAGLERAIDGLFAARKAPAAVLIVNSPGGSAVQSALIAARIRDLAAEKKRPVLAFVEDVAASGGYWLACAADEIFANPCSIVGSIGVISAGFGFTDAIARLGIERRVHTAGARKGLLDPFRPEGPDDLELLRELQLDIHEQFKAHVRSRRAGRLKLPEDSLFDGRIWAGQAALEAGLVDGIGEVRSVVRQRFGAKARLVTLNPPRSGWLMRRLRAEALALHMVEGAVELIEERAHWQRYGL